MLFFIGVFVSWNINKAVKGYFAFISSFRCWSCGRISLTRFFFPFLYILGGNVTSDVFLIVVCGEDIQREYAAIKFFLYTLFGSVLMLVGILGLYFTCGKTFDILLIMERAPEALDGALWWGMSAAKVIWILLFIGFLRSKSLFSFSYVVTA